LRASESLCPAKTELCREAGRGGSEVADLAA
jgi:hypothetical protein